MIDIDVIVIQRLRDRRCVSKSVYLCVFHDFVIEICTRVSTCVCFMILLLRYAQECLGVRVS